MGPRRRSRRTVPSFGLAGAWFRCSLSLQRSSGFPARSEGNVGIYGSDLAATLDGTAAGELVSGRTWQVTRQRGPGYDYWSWNADGSLCIRHGEKTGKCADTGRWKLEGGRLCYELTWWGAENKMKSACFRFSDLGKGRYAALQDNGLNLFEFAPVK